MKTPIQHNNKNTRIIFFAIILLIFSCNEIEPVIPPLGPQDLGDRKVLVEEFTGVQCVNCPQGSAEIENLIALYGKQLIAVSIHSGFFADPYNESKFDFRTTEGKQIEGLLGEPLGYPSAVVNRTQQLGRVILQLGQSAWASAIAEASQKKTLLNLNLEVDYDTNSRTLKLKTGILPIEIIAQNTSINVMLTESNIEDLQLTPDGKNANYIHQHVLRTLLTNFQGDPVGKLNKGELLERTFDFTLAQQWIAENCKLIVFVSDTDSNEVLQVEEIGLVE